MLVLVYHTPTCKACIFSLHQCLTMSYILHHLAYQSCTRLQLNSTALSDILSAETAASLQGWWPQALCCQSKNTQSNTSFCLAGCLAIFLAWLPGNLFCLPQLQAWHSERVFAMIELWYQSRRVVFPTINLESQSLASFREIFTPVLQTQATIPVFRAVSIPTCYINSSGASRVSILCLTLRYARLGLSRQSRTCLHLSRPALPAGCLSSARPLLPSFHSPQ